MPSELADQLRGCLDTSLPEGGPLAERVYRAHTQHCRFPHNPKSFPCFSKDKWGTSIHIGTLAIKNGAVYTKKNGVEFYAFDDQSSISHTANSRASIDD